MVSRCFFLIGIGVPWGREGWIASGREGKGWCCFEGGFHED